MAQSPDPVRRAIEEKLKTGLEPHLLEVVDESHRHVGHAGHRPEGETHFHVRAVSPLFAGESRLARQRRVYKLLSAELESRVHALSLDLKAPAEA